MPEMTKQQFDLIADMIRSREAPRTAAYMVLVMGKSNTETREKTGLSAQSVSNTLGRFRRRHKAIQEAYKCVF